MKKWIFSAALSASVLSGCASNGVKAIDPAEEWDKASTQADALIKEGKPQDALKALDEVAAKVPDRKEPWSRKARIYFDGKEYSRAILSAEEVLQRDPADRDAKGIRAVSGLRVAQQSLLDLRKEAGLKGDAQKDAVELVKMLREIVGDKIVMPAQAPVVAPAPKPAGPAPCGSKKRPCKTPGSGMSGMGGGMSSNSGGPFGALQ